MPPEQACSGRGWALVRGRFGVCARARACIRACVRTYGWSVGCHQTKRGHVVGATASRLVRAAKAGGRLSTSGVRGAVSSQVRRRCDARAGTSGVSVW